MSARVFGSLVCVGKNAMNGVSHCGNQLFGSLKGDGASEPNREVGEITVAGAANAHASDFKNAIHARDGVGNLRPDSGGRSVEEGVDGAARKPPADRNNHASHEQRCNRIGETQPVEMIDTA